MHDLETYVGEDGKKLATFASYLEPAWHGLGKVAMEPMSSAEILAAAKMDGWNVRLQPVMHHMGMVTDPTFLALRDGQGDLGMSEEARSTALAAYGDEVPQVALNLPVEGHNVVVRNNPFTGQPELFAVVKEKYAPVQNEELFELGDVLLNMSELDGASWETAGSIRGGRVVFGTIKMPDQLRIGQEDMIDKYLMVTSGHDGNTPVIAQTTPVRVVCANTWTCAMGDFKSRITFKHTRSVTQNLEKAKEAIRRSHQYYKALGAVGNALIAIPMDTNGFVKVIDKIWEKPEEDTYTQVIGEGSEPKTFVKNKRSISMWNNRRDRMVAVWEQKGERGETLGEAEGTAWGAVNAVGEALDWYESSKNGLERAAGFNDTTVAKKTEVLEYVSKRAKIKTKELVAEAIAIS